MISLGISQAHSLTKFGEALIFMKLAPLVPISGYCFPVRPVIATHFIDKEFVAGHGNDQAKAAAKVIRIAGVVIFRLAAVTPNVCVMTG